MVKFLQHLLSASLILGALLCTPAASAQRIGQKTLGVKLGYATENNSALAGISFDYRFAKHVALTPNVEYVFRNEHRDAFLFNIDCRFPFAVTSRFEIYPFAGINFASWAYHWDGDSARSNHIGFNFGAGCDYYCTSSLKLMFQAKYNAIKDVDSGYFSLGLGYVF